MKSVAPNSMTDVSISHGLATLVYGMSKLHMYLSNYKCGGPDSNRRTPAETDLESVAFNLARQPPLYFREFNLTYLIFASNFKELISKTVT